MSQLRTLENFLNSSPDTKIAIRITLCCHKNTTRNFVADKIQEFVKYLEKQLVEAKKTMSCTQKYILYTLELIKINGISFKLKL